MSKKSNIFRKRNYILLSIFLALILNFTLISLFYGNTMYWFLNAGINSFSHAILEEFVQRPTASRIATLPKATPSTIEKITKPFPDIKDFVSRNIELALADSPYTAIPQTTLKIKLPKTFSPYEAISNPFKILPVISLIGPKKLMPQIIRDLGECGFLKDPELRKQTPSYITNAYCQTVSKGYTFNQNTYAWSIINYGWSPSFAIFIINTPLTAKEWLGENLNFQGKKLKNYPEYQNLPIVEINKMKFITLNGECCAGYAMIYAYDNIVDKNLVIFMTNNLWTDTRNSAKDIPKGNIILDKIVATVVRN